jgi:hypothetical protein
VLDTLSSNIPGFVSRSMCFFNFALGVFGANRASPPETTMVQEVFLLLTSMVPLYG